MIAERLGPAMQRTPMTFGLLPQLHLSKYPARHDCPAKKIGRPGRTGTPINEKRTKGFPTSSPVPWKHLLPVHSDPGSTCPR